MYNNNNYNRNYPPMNESHSGGWFNPVNSFNNFQSSQYQPNQHNYHQQQHESYQNAVFSSPVQPSGDQYWPRGRGRGGNFPAINFRAMHHNNSNRSFPKPRGGSGKRPHERAEPSSRTSPQSRNQGETSPTPKRLLQKQNSFEYPRPGSSKQMPTNDTTNQQPQWQTPKKAPIDSPCKQMQIQKDLQWNELFAHALKVLDGCQEGQETSVLTKYLQPPRAAWIKTKEQIYRDMMLLMAPLGIEKLTVFGSSITNLDFIGSDIDYYIELKVPPINEDEARRAIQKAGKLSRSHQSVNFQLIFCVQHARVPIIRLLHIRSNTTCDVNFTSGFGYHNSCFINSVLNYDSRIRDLAIVLKLWSKSYKLSEKMVLSNYCLQMLMIFYLQNIQDPMLDTIKNNQAHHPPVILSPKFKWNFYFNDYINLSANNSQTFRELLTGFFEFYNKINVNENILSLYNGEFIPRSSFNDHEDLEPYRRIVSESNLPPIKSDNPQTFIVQDGFELNLNIGIKCQKHLDLFFGLIKQSTEKCVEMRQQSLAKLLITLFTDLKLPEVETRSEMRSKKKFTMTIHAIAGDLKLCQDILRAQDSTKICSSEDQQKFFFDHIYDDAKKFLQEVYLCEIVPEVTDTQEDPFKKEFKLTLTTDTINGRKKMVFKDESTINGEIELSKTMKEKKVPMELDVCMKISSKDKGKSVDIELVDNGVQKKSPLLNFSNFFAVNIPVALKYYLKKKWEDAKK